MSDKAPPSSRPIPIPLAPQTASLRERLVIGGLAVTAALTMVVGLIVVFTGPDDAVGGADDATAELATTDPQGAPTDGAPDALAMQTRRSTPTTERPPDLRRASEANDPDATTTTTTLTDENEQLISDFRIGAAELMPTVDVIDAQTIVGLSSGLCRIASDVDSLNDYSVMLALLWVGLEPDMRALYRNDGTVFDEASRTMIAIFCPDTFDRLNA